MHPFRNDPVDPVLRRPRGHVPQAGAAQLAFTPGLGFREDATAPEALSTDAFDAELAKLLDEGLGGASGPGIPTEE